jgi:hypothetical protein
MLMRSAVWMTLRESKSSFANEGEANQSLVKILPCC